MAPPKQETDMNNETCELTIDELACVSGGGIIGDIIKAIVVDVIINTHGLTDSINYIKAHS
jgi:bacteriocin-like protein